MLKTFSLVRDALSALFHPRDRQLILISSVISVQHKDFLSLLVIILLFNNMPPSPQSPEIMTDGRASCLDLFFLVDFSKMLKHTVGGGQQQNTEEMKNKLFR